METQCHGNRSDLVDGWYDDQLCCRSQIVCGHSLSLHTLKGGEEREGEGGERGGGGRERGRR